jgi:hypothetical protein
MKKVWRPSSNQVQSWLIFRSFVTYDVAFLPQDLAAGLTPAAITIPRQKATARPGSPRCHLRAVLHIFGILCLHSLWRPPLVDQAVQALGGQDSAAASDRAAYYKHTIYKPTMRIEKPMT